MNFNKNKMKRKEKKRKKRKFVILEIEIEVKLMKILGNKSKETKIDKCRMTFERLLKKKQTKTMLKL